VSSTVFARGTRSNRAMYDDIARLLGEYDVRLRHCSESLGTAPKAGTRPRIEFDERKEIPLDSTNEHSRGRFLCSLGCA